jgi:hypothetical protein
VTPNILEAIAGLCAHSSCLRSYGLGGYSPLDSRGFDQPVIDGNLGFRGTLKEPVAQAGVPLDKAQNFDGAGSVKGGEPTVPLRSPFVRGVSYTLPGSTGTPNEQMSGAGKALEFHNGQTLEMWFSSSTVYSKPANAGSQGQATL